MMKSTAPQLGRNDPCSCGSGKKYKKCCGLVVPIIAVPSPAPLSDQRHCGTCTACCDGWLKGTIYGHEMKPGTRCHFVGDGGCTIYERRPLAPCRQFVCGWAAPNSPFPEWFKPTTNGVIILPIKWRNQRAYRLAFAGRDPNAAMLDWMKEFSRQTGTPFFYEESGETLGYGPRAFLEDIMHRAARGEPLW